MTIKELAQILQSTGLPVAYEHFSEKNAPNMPFITYSESYSNNFSADSKVYAKISIIQVDLWTSKKDLEAEGKLEKALDDNDIFYQITYETDEDELCYRTIYEIQIQKG